MEHRFPVVLGKDFAGTVDAVGPGVTDYQVGDRVFGAVTKPYLGDGSFAEYVTVPTAVGIAVLPESIDFVTGAALGLAGSAAIAAVDAADPAARPDRPGRRRYRRRGQPGRPAGRPERSPRRGHRQLRR